MPNSVQITTAFENKYKRLVKKFVSLENEIDELIIKLLDNPTLGTSLGAGLYKIRLASKSKGGGKSGGFRVITYLVSEADEDNSIYLITIFDKSEQDSVDKKQLLEIVKKLFDAPPL